MGEENTSPGGRLRLVLKHFHAHPDRFTEAVGLNPDWVWLQGERRRAPNGRAIGGEDNRFLYNAWSWSEEYVDTPEAMKKLKKLKTLIELLELNREFVVSFVAGAQKAFLGIHFYGERNSGFILRPTQLRSLADLGIAFGAECFP